MEVWPYSYFQWCGYFWGPWVSFVTADEFSVRVTKLLQGLMSHELIAYLSVFNIYLTQWITAVLWKVCKPDNFESHNSVKLSFTNIRGLRSNFVDCESFLESNSPDILALCETNLDDSIDSGNFSVRGYLPLIRKDSITHMHGLAVYMKEGLPFARDLSLENSADSCLCFRLALLHSVQCLTSFSSIDYLFRLYARFLIICHLTSMWFSRSTHLTIFLSLKTLVSIIGTG